MLVSDDTARGGVRAKLLDFGLAKMLPRGEARPPDAKGGPPEPPPSHPDPPTPFPPQSVKTHTGVVMGTPAYMSPEQCRGATPLDGKTDVYSLGLLFFEMLYGEPPWGMRSAPELYALQLFAPPPDISQLVPGIPPAVAALVERILDKKPAARPTMEEFLAELHALPPTGLSDGPLQARPSASRPASSQLRDESPGDFILRQIARPAKPAELHRLETMVQNQGQNSGAASLGEQVAPPRRGTAAKLAAVVLMGGVLATALLLVARPPRATALAPGAQAMPVAAPPAPASSSPPPAAPAVAPAPNAAATENKPGVAASNNPSVHDKSLRKKPHGPGPAPGSGTLPAKNTKGTYEVRAWK